MNIKKVNGEITVETTTAELQAAQWSTDSNPQTYHIGTDDWNGELKVMPDDMCGNDVYYGASVTIDGHTITITDDMDGLHNYCDYDDCTLIIDGEDARIGSSDWHLITGGVMRWFDGDDRAEKANAINDFVRDAYAHDVRIVRVDGDYCNTYTLYPCHACAAARVAHKFGGDVLADDDAVDAMRLAMIGNGYDKYYCTINTDLLTHTGYRIAPVPADNAWTYDEAVKQATDYLRVIVAADAVDIIAESIKCDYDDYGEKWTWWQPCEPVKECTITRDNLD